MSTVFDKVVLAGMGLERKMRKKVDELAKDGEVEAEEGHEMKENFENELVENIVNVVGAGLKKVGVAKKEIDSVVESLAEDMAERLKIVTLDDLDVVEKLVMGTREKTLQLEKRVKKLESIIEKLTKEKDKAK